MQLLSVLLNFKKLKRRLVYYQ